MILINVFIYGIGTTSLITDTNTSSSINLNIENFNNSKNKAKTCGENKELLTYSIILIVIAYLIIYLLSKK